MSQRPGPGYDPKYDDPNWEQNERKTAMADDFEDWLTELENRDFGSGRRVGNDSNRASDLEKLRSTNPGDDLERVKSALTSQYERRADAPSGIDSSEMTRRGYGSGRDETADDRPSSSGSNVAQAWNREGGDAWGSPGGNVQSSLFPDWYRALLERQQQQQEAAAMENKQRADALYTDLSGRAKQSLAIDRNDPIIRQQADAYSANEERAKRNYLSDIAERSGPLANIRGEQRMAAERVGQRTGSFEAELLQRELTARRQEISEALRMSGSMLNADQQRQLQSELAMLDQAIKEAGIGLGAQGQALDYDLGVRGIGLGMRGQDLGFDQFLRQLAQRQYEFDAYPF